MRTRRFLCQQDVAVKILFCCWSCQLSDKSMFNGLQKTVGGQRVINTKSWGSWSVLRSCSRTIRLCITLGKEWQDNVWWIWRGIWKWGHWGFSWEGWLKCTGQNLGVQGPDWALTLSITMQRWNTSSKDRCSLVVVSQIIHMPSLNWCQCTVIQCQSYSLCRGNSRGWM